MIKRNGLGNPRSFLFINTLIGTRTDVRYNISRFATNEGHLLNRPVSIYPGIGGVVYDGT